MTGCFMKGAWVEDMHGAWTSGTNAGKLSTGTDTNTAPVFFQPTPQWAEDIIEEMHREIHHYYAVERFKKKMGLL